MNGTVDEKFKVTPCEASDDSDRLLAHFLKRGK